MQRRGRNVLVCSVCTVDSNGGGDLDIQTRVKKNQSALSIGPSEVRMLMLKHLYICVWKQCLMLSGWSVGR